MPLQGGIVLDLLKLDRFLWLKDGVARVEAGLKLIDLERHSLPRGWELRFHPSTRRTATIGGFIAGGSGGVGSVQFGGLRARGATCLACASSPWRPSRGRWNCAARRSCPRSTPTVPTASSSSSRCRWRAAGRGARLSCPSLTSARPPRSATPCARPTASCASWLRSAIGGRRSTSGRCSPHLKPGEAIALCVVADPSLEAFEALSAAMGGTIVFQRDAAEAGDIPPLYEFTWNHTTLWALKADRSITYLQCLFDGPDYLDKIARAVATFGVETPMHLEFTRLNGHVAAFGLQLVRYRNEARLYEIIRWLEANGCPVADPHTYILEDGGMKTVDEAQLAFKRRTDPLGLLNPGKMKAWSPHARDPAEDPAPLLVSDRAVRPAD